MRKAKMKKRIINEIGCLIARWILHNCEDGLVIKRKGGAEQIIKVFSAQAYKNVIAPAVRRTVEGSFRTGDVVTDNGYYGEIVITCMDYDGFFMGYGRKDGMVFKGLNTKKFKKVVGYVDLKID